MIPSIELVVFTLVALFMVVSSCAVAFSQNLIHSAFALMGSLLGSAVMYGLLAADFVAVTQLLVYVGGILILILFAVMLTADIADISLTNKPAHWKMAVPVVFALFIGLIAVLPGARWASIAAPKSESVVAPIGNALLQEYLLPFEVVSVLLLGALIGAVVLVRRAVR